MTSIYETPVSGIKIIVQKGRLDTNSSSEFEFIISPVAAAGYSVIVDLTDCTYISSIGIRMLIKAAKTIKAHHGMFVLAGLTTAVSEVIEMAGLSRVFSIEDNVENAVTTVQKLLSGQAGLISREVSGRTFMLRNLPEGLHESFLWKNDGIAGYNELGISVGFGFPAEAGTDSGEYTGLFVSAKGCAGFIPDDERVEPDFRLAADTVRSGINILEAVSFRELSPAILQIDAGKPIQMSEISDAISNLEKDPVLSGKKITLLAIVDRNPSNPSFSITMHTSGLSENVYSEAGLRLFSQYTGTTGKSSQYPGITFLLESPVDIQGEISFEQFLDTRLTLENISGIRPACGLDMLENPLIWIFSAGKFTSSSSIRLKIEAAGESQPEPWKAFLIRRLYQDSAAIRIEPLHGGFSAQTYQVTSWDPEGRKMRPTVLKIASRSLILRESERCRQYALPYIFNNSAIVLGAEFYGEMGALRYNFVGIGGEKSKLKWLTHYYQKSDIELVISLYDKVFLDILKPWHGQPVKKNLYPFKDHDPTLTFFPGIYQAAADVFNIDSGSPHISVKGLDRLLLNPYWFLRHEFARRREESIEYYSGICHGDLNMQNILLDENMNIYLIDFSETKPRSVISDYARLEAILMVDNAPVETDEDLIQYVDFMKSFYNTGVLTDTTSAVYNGRFGEKVTRNLTLAMKLRSYALRSVEGNPDALPYYLALLEWVLPIVCWTIPDSVKRVSMVVAGLVAEQIYKSNENYKF